MRVFTNNDRPVFEMAGSHAAKRNNGGEVAREFHKTWVSCFGSPEIITSDQGQQFEANFLNKLIKIIGIRRIHTTPWNLKSNGMFIFISWCGTADWYFTLPLTLMKLCTQIRLEENLSTAETLFGQALRVHSTQNSIVDLKNLHLWILKFSMDLSVFLDLQNLHLWILKFPVDLYLHYQLLIKKQICPPLIKVGNR